MNNSPSEEKEHSAEPSLSNPDGEHFHFRGIKFLFVTQENHPFRHWICYQHTDGQWVSLFKCESPQLRLLTDLQSQLADLKRENEETTQVLINTRLLAADKAAELKAEITDREKIQQEQLQIIVNQHDRIEKQHSENSKLKAKADWVANELRAILASEGKE